MPPPPPPLPTTTNAAANHRHRSSLTSSLILALPPPHEAKFPISLQISSPPHTPHTLPPLPKPPLFGTGKISTLLHHPLQVPITSTIENNSKKKIMQPIQLPNSLTNPERVKMLIPESNIVTPHMMPKDSNQRDPNMTISMKSSQRFRFRSIGVIIFFQKSTLRRKGKR